RARDLRLSLERRREERHAVAEARVAHASGARAGDRQRVAARVEMEFRPARAGQRPLALGPLDEALAGMADLQEHARLPRPAGVLALEEVAEELLLQRDLVIRVEVR